MAHFKLKIVGDLAELAGIAAALAGTPTEHAVAAPRVVGSPPELAAPYGDATEQPTDIYVDTAGRVLVDPAKDGGQPVVDKPKRTRKASTVDTPATGAETFAEQIKEVVASEAAEVPTAAAAATADAAATTDASSSASATTASASERPADLKEACQALVKKLMGDSRYQTADILKALEAFGGKGVTAIAENHADNLPALFDKLTSMAAV